MKSNHLPIYLIVFFTAIILSMLLLPSASFGQTSCAPGLNSSTNPNRIQLYNGFLSVTTNNVVSQISISDTDKYICGYKAIIPQFAIPSYKEFKNTYYDQAKAAVVTKRIFTTTTSNPNANPANLDLSGSKDIIYHIKGGNLIIDRPINTDHTLIVFVDGNLDINQDINSPNGMVFVVGGYIRVQWDVQQINALMMSYEQFCSGWYNSIYGCSINFFKDRLASNPDNPKLLINGSVVSLSAKEAAKPAFVRYIRDNITPAEEIDYQAMYLVILRKIFSRTRIIYTAIN